MDLTYTIGGSFAIISFDGAIRESHMSTVIVTEYPVERGAPIADHVRPENVKFTVDAMVTNTPIDSPTSNASGVKGSVKGYGLFVPTTQTILTDKTLTYPERNHLPIGLPGIGAAIEASGVLNSEGTTQVRTLDRGADQSTTVNANVLQFDGEFDRVGDIFHELQTLQESATLVAVHTTLKSYEDMIIQSISAPRTAADGSAITFSLNFQGIKFAETKTVVAPANPKKPVAKKDLGAQGTKPEPLKSFAAGLADGDGAKAFKALVHH